MIHIFRAWHPVKKIMFSPEQMGSDQLMLSPDGSGFWNVSSISVKLSQQVPMVPMQFTGVKDKNGKEIYEGDILKLSDLVTDEIVFREGQFLPKHCLPHEGADFMRDGEVVGNIYQNPELKK